MYVKIQFSTVKDQDWAKNAVLINLELDICCAYKINARYIFPSLNFYYKPKKQSKTKTKIEYYNFITTYENRVLYCSKWVKSNVFCVLSIRCIEQLIPSGCNEIYLICVTLSRLISLIQNL